MHLPKWILGGGDHSQDANMGLSDHTGDSDNSNSFWHHSEITNGRNIDLLGEDSDSEIHGEVGILTNIFSQNSLGQAGEAHRIYIDRCIIFPFSIPNSYIVSSDLFHSIVLGFSFLYHIII